MRHARDPFYKAFYMFGFIVLILIFVFGTQAYFYWADDNTAKDAGYKNWDYYQQAIQKQEQLDKENNTIHSNITILDKKYESHIYGENFKVFYQRGYDSQIIEEDNKDLYYKTDVGKKYNQDFYEGNRI